MYRNIAESDLYEARNKYTIAFMLSTESAYDSVDLEDLYHAIGLLDKALKYVPNFLDASYLREEIWNKLLVSTKDTPDQQNAYKAYLKSNAWTGKKEQVLKRDDYKCVLCCKPAEHVHHRTYDNIGKESLCDLTSLCQDCHLRYHGDTNIFHPIALDDTNIFAPVVLDDRDIFPPVDIYESDEPVNDPQSRESSPKQTDVDAMLNEILNPKNFKHLKEKEFVVCPEVEDDIPWNP